MYKNLDTSAKWNLVKNQKLCFCCLKYGHAVRSCRLKRACGNHGCDKRHHPSLHEENQAKVSTFRVTNHPNPVVKENILSCNKDKENKILFRVLPVRLYGDDVAIRTYALLNEGSSVTIMSMQLASDLRLKGRKTDLRLKWFGKESFANESFAVDLCISADRDGAERFKIEEAQTVNELRLPTQTLTLSDFGSETMTDILFNLPVSEYNEVSPQILIGLDNCHLGAPIRTIGSKISGLIVSETKLGYVVYGRAQKITTTANSSTNALVLHADTEDYEDEEKLTRMVDEYFSIENFGVTKPKKKLISENDKRALQILSSTTKKNDNHYQTGLLWKQNTIELPPSYDMARRRLDNLESKFRREPEFAAEYRNIISSYVEKGYARKLTPIEAKVKSPRTWYLPHFGARNPNKTEKIRLVFDAAAKVDGVSLNSMLLKGPDDLKPLMTILYNFRMRRIAVTGDIKEMFHQVKIQTEDQNSQRFLWRESEDHPVEVYVMQSMTFGATCSPCSAYYVKNMNAQRFTSRYPSAVTAIIDHHYVDDYVESFNSVAEAIDVTKAVVSIHKSGGFQLRNFLSNSEEVLVNVLSQAEEHHGKVANMNVEAVAEKVLGMYWDPKEDVFLFKLNFSRVSEDIIPGRRSPTKRELLAVTMSVFDPYGMIANFVIHAKLLVQLVWRTGIGWDHVPEEIFHKWCQWKSELHKVMQLRVPRCYHPSLYLASRVVLHTFVDASEEAFCAAVYMGVEYLKEVSVTFICGKTRCAPKKLTSIPRLELSAAVLGIRLCDSIVQSHKLKLDDRVYWSDSRTVLSWLRSDPQHQKQFVGFRIVEILDSSKLHQWRWVPTRLNPSDEATRGRYPPAFLVENKWINGASFLGLPTDRWPPQPDNFTTLACREEMKPKFLFHINVSTPPFEFSRFSSYLKMKRAAAWTLRFVKACRRQPIEGGELSAQELEEAERTLCKTVQRDVFAEELCRLSRNQRVEKESPIYKMEPHLDDDGLLRVYGRIDAATTIPFNSRPFILPKDHRLTQLIVAHFHRRLGHQNDDTVANEIRQSFWIPSLRSTIRKERSRCPFCLVRSTCPLPPMMGQLPEDRLTPFVRPFTYTGLNYFGPVNVTIGRRRAKRWVALFTCLTVRAVHLELAADLSTDACLLCIRNFVNRRGVPVRIRSDNGTNFIGAKNELLTADIFDCDAIKAELSARGIEWIFNCPFNPHAGGCWERLVRSVKRVLSVTLHELAPKTETLISALIEAENIVNSRPLTHIPVTTEEEEPLTPNHFLLGVNNSTQTPGPIDERALCLRKQWRISQQIKDRFWHRWIKEYLPELTMRSKWFAKVPNLKEGDLVLVCDRSVPRSQWIRGRIVRVYVGPDEQVRSADIKTSSGTLRRPAVKLAVLKVSGEALLEPGASRGVGY